ncbi:MAG: type II toxin-antitoxin system RelE/ParE family toxin [Candidatus Eremiobacteraeota bacterium]|nr:type II toxin-antitoxin system RelE/ParE family toxin [Candidatus Eremiobacteraeota bacterium]MBV8355563.1 type II toxin-antitoxin system RelE/ParE family toxin [Candidatus Eremiobacteraeota bacterium]
MATVRFSDGASNDLVQIWGYYAAAGTTESASAVISRIRATIRQTLGRFPRSGRLRPEFGEDVRSYPILPYVVFYTVEKRAVRIIRILHGHRDIRAPLVSLFIAV